MSGLEGRAILVGFLRLLAGEVSIDVADICFTFDFWNEWGRDFLVDHVIPIDAGEERM